ncbi:MAG: hypothetical protein JKY09_07405 [Crocinitomicaceae bacterium]|nr:hypothetical protein [Crocinitomicaceae bacterium]
MRGSKEISTNRPRTSWKLAKDVSLKELDEALSLDNQLLKKNEVKKRKNAHVYELQLKRKK